MPPRKRARGPARHSHRSTDGGWRAFAPLLTVLRTGLQRSTPVWVLLLLVGAGVVSARRYVEASSVFTLQRIHEPSNPDWRRPVALEAQPILQLHVESITAQLSRANPQMKFIRVTRQWPADLIIEAIPRHPVAQLKLREYFPLDEEGFVFAAGTPAPQPALPTVEGVEQLGQRVTPGNVITTPSVQLALRLLQLLHATPSMRHETITLLNVADPHQITFRLQRGIEVRLGDAEAASKMLARLGSLLAKLNAEQLTPQYIDLRFADPVIGPR